MYDEVARTDGGRCRGAHAQVYPSHGKRDHDYSVTTPLGTGDVCCEEVPSTLTGCCPGTTTVYDVDNPYAFLEGYQVFVDNVRIVH